MARDVSESFRTLDLLPGTSLHSLVRLFGRFQNSPRSKDNFYRLGAMIDALNAHREGVKKEITLAKEGTLTSANFPVLWGVQPEDLPF
jgi:hypothetical protein